MISCLGNRAVYAALFAVVGVGSIVVGYSTGAVAGLFLGRWMSPEGTARGIAKCGLSMFTVCAALSFGYLITASPSEKFMGLLGSWDSKCASNYCGRVLGPGLDVSPFPVGVPSCGALNMCANEYPFTPDRYQELLAIMSDQGCGVP